MDHTADVGIRAYGEGLDALFANAAAGMFSLITDLEAVKPVGEYALQVTAKDVKSLLFDYLSELLFLHETQKLLFSEFEAKVSGVAVDAQGRGGPDHRHAPPPH